MIYFLTMLFSFLAGFVTGSLYTINNSAIVRQVLEFILRYIIPMIWR